MVLPAKAPVIGARGAAVFAPAKAAGPRSHPLPPAPGRRGEGHWGAALLCQSPQEPPEALLRPYPDSKPGRGSLKVVVRVLWSTKYRTLSLVYFISQPGGSGGSWIILLAKKGSPHSPLGQSPPQQSALCQAKGRICGTGLTSNCPHPRRGVLPGQHSGHGTARASLSICGTHGLSAGPRRAAPSQTLLPPQPPTLACEGLPTAWSGCCGSRNTLAHCPVSSLGENGEEALAGVLGTALPFPACRKFVSSPIPPPHLVWKKQDKPHIPSVCPSCLSLAVPACRRCQGRGTGAVLSHTPSGTHTAPPGTRSRIPPRGPTGAFPNSLHSSLQRTRV